MAIHPCHGRSERDHVSRPPTMLVRQTSSPPDTERSTPAPDAHNSFSPPPHRKRKHAGGGATAVIVTNASSPAPSDGGIAFSDAGPADGEVVAADVQASASRPRLTVSRGPVFLPVAEGSKYHTTDQVCMNRLGYRYVPAGLAEPGSKIPYRTIESRPAGYVRVSWEDRNPLIMVTQDGLGLCGEKGFRSARLNVPVREGKWYMEVRIEKGGGDDADSGREGAHVRLGWGRREAQLNGPAGLDGYSYAYRDKTGDKVTVSRPRPYGRPFKTGDVIGMYISLPSKRKPKANDPYDPAHIRRERIAIDFKGQEYFECVEYSQSKEMLALMDENNKSKSTASVPSSSKKSATVKNLPERGRQAKATPEPAPLQPLPTLKNSKIGFFVNGECQGVAFEDVFDYLQLRTVPSKRKNQNKRKREGIRTHTDNPFDDGWLGYYPFISLFNGAEVTLNPGPDFEHPPPDDIDCLMEDKKVKGDHSRKWRPLSERYAEFMAEQWALDAQEEEETQGVLSQLLGPPVEDEPDDAMEVDSAREFKTPVPREGRSSHTREPKASVAREPRASFASSSAPQQRPAPPVASSSTARATTTTSRSASSKKPTVPPVYGPLTEVEFKAAARRERKRIAEQKRRARKAEEARAAKAAKERADAGIIDEELPDVGAQTEALASVSPVAPYPADPGMSSVYQSGVFKNVHDGPPSVHVESSSYHSMHQSPNDSWQYDEQPRAHYPPDQPQEVEEDEETPNSPPPHPAFDPALIDPALM